LCPILGCSLKDLHLEVRASRVDGSGVCTFLNDALDSPPDSGRRVAVGDDLAIVEAMEMNIHVYADVRGKGA